MVERWREQPKSGSRHTRSDAGGGPETPATDPIRADGPAPAATEVMPAADAAPETEAIPAGDGAPATEAIPAGDATPTPNSGTWTRILLLGAEETSRDVVIALQRLGAEVIVAERHSGTPRIADRSVVVDAANADQLAATIARLQPGFVVVAGSDPIAAEALGAAAEAGSTAVIPSVRGARLGADREGMRRLAADELGLPTAPFWFAGSVEELRAVAEHAGFPMLVKPVTAARGEGVSLMLRPDDVVPAWQRAVTTGAGKVMAETLVEVDDEVTLLTVRSVGADGPTLDFCAPIGHRQVDADGRPTLESWQPQPMSAAALDAARSIAARVVTALDGRGVFGVELMIHGDEVYFSDVTVHPQDTALVTLRSQRLSAAELQARAILGLPVDTIMISPGAARVIYADGEAVEATANGPGPAAALAGALAVPETDVAVFSHDDGHPRHRLGAAVATGSDVTVARAHAERACAALTKRWP